MAGRSQRTYGDRAAQLNPILTVSTAQPILHPYYVRHQPVEPFPNPIKKLGETITPSLLSLLSVSY